MTFQQIEQAVNDRIKQAVSGFAGMEIVDADLQKPVVRPSLKILLEDVQTGKFNSGCVEKKMTCRVYFFAKDERRPRRENAAMREALSAALLEDLIVEGEGSIPIGETDFTTADGVLAAAFELYVLELLPQAGDDAPPMENLMIDERMK